MKIHLKEIEVTLSEQEATGPLGNIFSKWANKCPDLQETCLLPTVEIANKLQMRIEAFRLWLYRDERLQKLAYLRDGSPAPLRNRASKYFRLSEVRALYVDRKKLKMKSFSNHSSVAVVSETGGDYP